MGLDLSFLQAALLSDIIGHGVIPTILCRQFVIWNDPDIKMEAGKIELATPSPFRIFLNGAWQVLFLTLFFF